MSRFAVLMYHRIDSPRCPVNDPAERRYSVSLQEFEWQMDRIRASGRIGVSMEQVHDTLAAGTPIPPEWVALTFDDGNMSDHEHALPLLAERGFGATFFVSGCRVGVEGGLERFMLTELRSAGMHLGSHAMTHRFLTTLSDREEETELRDSRDLLESITGESVDHFAPPGGRWSRRTKRALEHLGFRAVSTSAFGYNDSGRVRFAYRRIPIVRATSRRRFEDVVRGGRVRLVPGYLRAYSLRLLRGAVGESVYPRNGKRC